MVVLDLDHFRHFNDAHGHAAGDRALAAVGTVIGERIRGVDRVGRVGGDEFAVLLPFTALDGAIETAADLLGALRSMRDAPTASAGVAASSAERPLSATELLAEADQAMLAAKEGGRDRLLAAVPDGAGPRLARERFAWSARIREALETGGIALHGQPIVALNGPSPPRYELLARLGDVAPAAFMPTAERFGQVQAIDGWAVGRALELLQRTEAAGWILHVNLAPASIADPELAAFVERAVVASGVDPSRLVIELTETAAFRDIERVASAVTRLRGLGCAIALDDFGTGFASFAHLKHLPVDVVKIAGDFVREVRTSRMDRLTVEAMVHIAAGMGMLTVAEYVEDEATLRTVRGMGLDFGQGYHLGPPRPLRLA